MARRQSSAERYGQMFAELTDTNWKFGAGITAIFLTVTICLTLWIVSYLPTQQITLEPLATIMNILRPFMFIFPLVVAGLAFIAGFRTMKSYKNSH